MRTIRFVFQDGVTLDLDLAGFGVHCFGARVDRLCLEHGSIIRWDVVTVGEA